MVSANENGPIWHTAWGFFSLSLYRLTQAALAVDEELHRIRPLFSMVHKCTVQLDSLTNSFTLVRSAALRFV